MNNDKPVISVEEPCAHSIQIRGLCALCGNDMTKTDFTGVDYSQRATISMAHNVAGLTVSLDEAERLEKETAERLLKSRKLSLIVDLDQTLIHATIDPTVAEWMNDENNINHPTTKDIHKFVLSDSPTVYYIKLRPGLKEFLKSVSDVFEPHIYTMGTRNYASSVANIIDPDQKIFNERILSRDESRNINQKNIRRLFPCDDSMVVAIDDRADVWGWSPNLIKVHPYDFFVGIGDINDTRYLKQSKPINSISKDPSSSLNDDTIAQQTLSTDSEQDNKISHDDTEQDNKISHDDIEQDNKISHDDIEQNSKTSHDNTIVQPTLSTDSEQDNKVSQEELIDGSTETVNSVIPEEKSLETDFVNLKDTVTSDEKTSKEPLKLKVVNTSKNSTPTTTVEKSSQNSKRTYEEASEDSANPDEKTLKKQQIERDENVNKEMHDHWLKTRAKPVLVDNDTELPNLLKALKAIHKRYYEEYDKMQNDLQMNGKPKMPDVTVLVPSMKAEVLKGVNILFTHVIPTSQKKESAEIWILAKEFGAECSESWNSKVSHLVAGDRGTEKVKEAIRKGNVFIVRKEWLHDSIKKWERQPERDYTFEPCTIRESDSGQVSEIDKPPDLIVETPSVNEITDDEGLLSPQERQEHFIETDWKSILCEVEEEIGESGDTSALDESETESGTESNGRIKLKRNSDDLSIYDRNAKRIKQSPLRNFITFNNSDDDDDDEEEEEEEDHSNTNIQILVTDGEPITDFGLSPEIYDQNSENQYDDEQEELEYDEYGYDYDAGNQSDDEGGEEDDSDDEEFVHDFEEFLKQDQDDNLSTK